MIKNKANFTSEVNFRNNDHIIVFSINFKQAKIHFFTYANKKISITFASPTSISCHFQTASFRVKKKKTQYPKVRNTIYLKMKTASLKFHFGSDGSSSTECPRNIKFKAFLFFLLFFWDRGATGAGRQPSHEAFICATFGQGEGSVNQPQSPPRGDKRAWHPNTERHPLAVSLECSHPWLITVRWCV